MTREKCKELLVVMQAYVDGKTLQCRYGPAGPWETLGNNIILSEGFEYRIKPEKKRVPLGPDDVKPGAAFRRLEWGENLWCVVLGVGPESFMIQVGVDCYPNSIKFLELCWQSDAQISNDGGKTWQPCYKEEWTNE